MTTHKNAQGQPIGAPVPDWQGAPFPPHEVIKGERVDLAPLSIAHAEGLHAAFSADTTGTLWTYMPGGPYADAAAYRDWIASVAGQADPQFYTVIDKATDTPVGVASYLRITPSQGTIEVGWITFSPTLQRTPHATEAMYLMMKRAFDLGYRRYEWKCDALNAASRKAAERLGFIYEGTFRQAVVYKGRNRDTAWFSITDQEWPDVRERLETWLASSNFDADGMQLTKLAQT